MTPLLAIVFLCIGCYITAINSQSNKSSSDLNRCQSNIKCIVDCTHPIECNANVINATQSVALAISGCNENCNDMTIYCPHNTDNIEYECQISAYFNSSSAIRNLHIYGESMDAVEIDFYMVINSVLHCASNRKCNINMAGDLCSNNSTMCTDNHSLTPTSSPTIDGIVINIDDLVLYVGIFLIILLFCGCAILICLIGIFCHLRLKHRKQSIDKSIDKLFQKHSMDIINMKRKELQSIATERKSSIYSNHYQENKKQSKPLIDGIELEPKEIEFAKLHPNPISHQSLSTSPAPISVSPVDTDNTSDLYTTTATSSHPTTGESRKATLPKAVTRGQWM